MKFCCRLKARLRRPEEDDRFSDIADEMADQWFGDLVTIEMVRGRCYELNERIATLDVEQAD